MTTRRDSDGGRGRVRIPADFERPDKLLAGLTARQLAILAVAAVALWAGYAATRHLVPAAVYGALALPIGAAAAMLALGRFEGIAADRWVTAAWRHHRAPHRLVPAPDGVPAAPAFLATNPGPTPVALRLPFAGVGGDGIVDLGPDGQAVICRASAVTFSLRTPTEQEALVAGFARWLNGLDQPAQLLVRAEPVDLTPSIDALLDAAPGLPHPALESAARAHAAFLAELADRRDLLRREVLVVLRHPPSSNNIGADATARLQRRAAEAASALGAAGVTLVALDGPDTATCLARALDPAGELRPVGLAGTAVYGAGLYGAEQPVTLARHPKGTAPVKRVNP
ncbi:PrgI family protein [Acidiferrimicrobium sp. IK]|uniref:PrgI family protein n=1 Tax=Acidiferrimicrobium sp. IK TaxID=2871700 RepID=UPI0021CAE35B|nr:PrgI family protein [Acidiferrimicrobium sp. IK]MCU4187366.1 PrgI family protein [Acidiferrimicrobium sp. IK]